MTVGYVGEWLIPCGESAVPIRDGAVVLDSAGVVLDVGPEAELRARFGAARWSRERAILLPGLVNAHTHLELSGLRGQTRSGGGFGRWVSSMMQARQRLHPEQDSESIENAVSELIRCGTVAIGEITNSLHTLSALGTAPLLVRVFHEIFGVRSETAAIMRQLAAQARAELNVLPPNLSYVPAPHTLYSLHPQAVREIVADARALGLSTSLHLSEHAAEHAFLRDGSGPFRDYLETRGVDPPDWQPPGLSPTAYAEQLGALAPDVIVVHLCAASADEIRQVAAAQAKVVLCPRSNLFIELKLPPLYDILAAGIKPGLGTDSLASNTTLDVLAEAVALADRFPTVDPLEFLRMATFYGARVLGFEKELGALAPGFSPGLLAFTVEGRVEDPARYLLRHPNVERRVLARGRLSLPGSRADPCPSTPEKTT